MKLRFSLRAMLILVTCAAALCWWRDRPRRMADRFVEAVEAGRYSEADLMFDDPCERLLAKFVERDDRNRIKAKRQPQTPGEWLRGECRVAVALDDFEGLGGYSVVYMHASGHGMEHGPVAKPAEGVQYDDDLEISVEPRR